VEANALLAYTSTLSDESQSLPDAPDSPPPAPGSRDSLKYLPDGAYVHINNIVASAAFPMGFFYVERSDRSFGIRVSYPWLSWDISGQLVDVRGWMATDNGERVVVADGPDAVELYGGPYPLPAALGMCNRSLGGGAVGPYTPAVGDGYGLTQHRPFREDLGQGDGSVPQRE